MEYHFTVPGALPGLNDYLKAERKFTRRGGTAHSVGNDMKQENQMFICNAIRLQLKRLKIQQPVHISYRFYELNRRRDVNLQDGKGYFRPAEDEDNLVLAWDKIGDFRYKNYRRNASSGERYLRWKNHKQKQRENKLDGQMNIFDFLKGG